jgi:hypothetical protein
VKESAKFPVASDIGVKLESILAWNMLLAAAAQVRLLAT